ncbi:hypothetical protein CO661_01985 [Sinorhizobium fredii]|uniref:Anti-sigma factor NepR domain-containing protein n=1 Tax=Rhizobium fredii TaxID=380 RepID=A0A2A6M6D7_RHIFR|nr:hypothetical protein CO661_01985 [Sinorhizobium fredii]
MRDPSRSLAAPIRRQMKTARSTKFLRSLPAFQLKSELPPKISELLQRLHDREIEEDADKPG